MSPNRRPIREGADPAPSLRERAAASKAAVSKATRDGQPAAAKPDPVIDLIGEARRLMYVSDVAYAASTDVHDDDPRFAELQALQSAFWDHVEGKLLKTTPQTANGCRELASFSLEVSKNQGVPLSEDADAVARLIAGSPLL